jgi:hypothetical protein
MNPNFDNMTTEELRAYVLSHREDTTALYALIDRKSPEPRIQYP